MQKAANKSLHLTAIPLALHAASELGRYATKGLYQDLFWRMDSAK